MPRMNEPATSEQMAKRLLIKLLLIGDGKLGKTFYAALAAKAGFNVLYLDGDVAAATIGAMVQNKTLTPEEASRIYLLDVADTIMGGVRDTKFAETMQEFTSNVVFRWNDTNQRVATRRDTDKEVWEIRPGLMGPNDLLVMDSWTSYTESIMLLVGRANGVDIATATTHEMRPVYQMGALKATQMLQMIRSMPAHMIAIGHPDEYTHTTKPEGKKAKDISEKDLVVDWTKLVAKSTSKPQGLVMPKYFTDVAWMELSPSGSERRLNFKPKNDRVGGGHFNDSKSVDEYAFDKLVKAIGGPAPTPCEPAWLKIIPPRTAEEVAADVAAAEESKVLDGTKPTVVKGPGMASLFAKKADTAPAA